MNDVIMIAGAVAGVVAVLAVGLYNAVYGVHANLSNARVGEVYNFDYEQPLHGGHKRILAKVIEPVTTLDDSWIKIMNRRSRYRRNDPDFKRTNHLVTCQTADGEIRQYYAERASNVRRSLLGGVVLKTGVAALIF
jgi:hypothetical protein